MREGGDDAVPVALAFEPHMVAHGLAAGSASGDAVSTHVFRRSMARTESALAVIDQERSLAKSRPKTFRRPATSCHAEGVAQSACHEIPAEVSGGVDRAGAGAAFRVCAVQHCNVADPQRTSG